MPRKPVVMEMVGGKTPRQRVWEVMRLMRDGFTQVDLEKKSKVETGIVKDYVKPLLKAGFIVVVSEEKVKGACVRCTYKLVKDNGMEAPRLSKTGALVVQGSGNERLWGTMRRMFKVNDFTHRELAALASTATDEVSEATAKSYVMALSAAGYLECTKEGRRGHKATPNRYRLIPAMDTGPRAPMVQRTKQVFDPNKNEVMWREEKGIEDEQ